MKKPKQGDIPTKETCLGHFEADAGGQTDINASGCLNHWSKCQLMSVRGTLVSGRGCIRSSANWTSTQYAAAAASAQQILCHHK